MFGMTVFYRAGVVFAALPLTRAFENAQSVAFKLYRKTPRIQKMLESDPRLRGSFREEGKWIALELESEKDLADALKWFGLAYHTCLSSNNSKT